MSLSRSTDTGLKMRIKYTTLLLYGAGAILTVFLSFGTMDTPTNTIGHNDIRTLKFGKIDSYLTPVDTNRSFAYLWGIKASEDTPQATTDQNKQSKPTIKKRENTLCIGQKCFRILGIYEKNGQTFVTLSHSKFKNGRRDFKQGDVLTDPIIIDKITIDTVRFANQSETSDGSLWTFELFDVNATKYKPKDTNETLL